MPATCRDRFAPSCRTAPPKLTQARGFAWIAARTFAWSRPLACEDELAMAEPFLNVLSKRPCHEKEQIAEGPMWMVPGWNQPNAVFS